MTIQPMVIDLSHWDPADNYSKVKTAGIVGVIYKATDNPPYVDPTYKIQKAAAKAAGLLWGSYHFAHPGNVQEQATHYLTNAAPEKDEIFCLDWEATNNGTMTAAEAQAWIGGVETALGRPEQCLIYSGNAAKEQLSGVNEFFSKRRLWLAQYGTNPTTQASWPSAWLWQFTDGQVGPTPHSIPGVGPCDISSFAGTADQLAAQWSGQPVGPELVVTVTISAPAGVIVNVKRE